MPVDRALAMLICAVIALLWPCHDAQAQASPNRILQTFDFEELPDNVEDIPLGWQKVEGPGLPHFARGQFDRQVYRSRDTSFRLDLNGGSIIYRYPADTPPVLTDAVYQVRGHIRTTPLKYARARVTAYFADIDQRPIPASIRHSGDVMSAPGDRSWNPFVIDLPADDPAAHSIVIEVALLQPQLRDDPTLGAHTLPMQDIRGSAWFDDITLAHVPRVTINTQRPAGIFRRSDPPRLDVRVRDRLTQDLAARLEVRDVDGQIAFQRSGTLDLGVGSHRFELAGSIDLGDLQPGWYQARLLLLSTGQEVGEHVICFVRLPDDLPGAPIDPRFGLIATHLHPQQWAALPGILDQLTIGRIKLAVWSRDSAVERDDVVRLDRLLADLASRGVQLIACLVDLPPSVRQTTGARDWLDLLRVQNQAWREQLRYLVARHANHLRQWQFLPDEQADRFVREPQLREVYRLLLSEFAAVLGQPDLAMPWPAWFELDGALPPTVALRLPTEVLPEQIPLYVRELTGSTAHQLSLSIQPIDRQRYGRLLQTRDLALRIAHALAAGVERIDVPLPLRARPQVGGDLTIEPEDLYVPIRTLTNHLAGTEFRGRVPITPEVEAFLFERQKQGVVLLWSRDVRDESRKFDVALGGSPVRIELTGVATPLPPTNTSTRRELHTIEVGQLPVLIEGVDAQLMLMRAGIRIDNPLLESSFEPHTRMLSIVNTFAYNVSGTLRVSGPRGWAVTTPVNSFSLNPGETLSVPVVLEFPFNTYAGEKLLDVELHVQGRAEYSMKVPIVMKLGLSDVGLSTMALRDGRDIIVQQLITNYSKAAIDYTAFVVVPGRARQERLVANLGPGRSVIKRYRFAGVSADTIRLRSGLRELEGTRVHNEQVEVK